MRSMILVSVILVAGPVHAQQFKSDPARRAMAAFHQTETRARAVFDRAMSSARSRLKRGLEAAKTDATKAGNLEEAVKIALAVKHLTTPSKAPRVTKSLVGKWRFRFPKDTKSRIIVFARDGLVEVTANDGKVVKGRLTQRGGDVFIAFPRNYDRVTVHGNRLFLESYRKKETPNNRFPISWAVGYKVAK